MSDFTKSFKVTVARFDSLPEGKKADYHRSRDIKAELRQVRREIAAQPETTREILSGRFRPTDNA